MPGVNSPLPVIRVVAQATADERDEVTAILHRQDNRRREALMPWFERFDALNYARNAATRYAEQARESIASLPQTPARDVLMQLTEFVVCRAV